MHILFICTGNTCRSPMAEGWLKHLIGINDRLSVSSAGIHACDGEPASSGAILAMKKRGVDLSGHKARFATDEMLGSADVVLCMGESHCEALAGRVEQNRLCTLLGFAYGLKGPLASIADPFMGEEAVYEAVCAEICGAVEILLERLS